MILFLFAQEGSNPNLVLRLRGGGSGLAGVKFADVSNAGNLVKIPWADTAPEWRLAAPGLCVEGVCLNRKCAAYRQMVICNMGMTSFDLLLDRSSCTCPMCHSR